MTTLTKGFVLELYCKYVDNIISLDAFLEIIAEHQSISLTEINTDALFSKLRRLKSTDTKKRGKYRHMLRQETFDIPLTSSEEPQKEAVSEYQAVASSLAVELAQKETQLESERVESEKRYAEVERKKGIISRHLDERRIAARQFQERAKQFKRKLERIKQAKAKPVSAPIKKPKLLSREASLSGRLSALRRSLTSVKAANRKHQEEIESLKKRVSLTEERESLAQNQVGLLEKRLSAQKESCTEHQVSLDYAISLLQDTDEVNLFDDDKKTFTARCIECVMNLDGQNVPNHRIPSVIAEVLKLVGKHPNRLPSRSTVDSIVQAKGLVSRRQLSEMLPAEKDTTLYTDETRKFAKSYNVYLTTDVDANVYLLGLREMSNKSAQTCLDSFEEILQDISTCADGKHATQIGKEIVANIKNTMSDRAQTEVAFNRLLEQYRTNILPSVHSNWNELSSEERNACSKMNNFFCGLHLLVSFAEICASTLLKFEATFAVEPVGAEADEELKAAFCFGNDASCIRVIRAASKCFSRGGDEKSGCYGQFEVFCRSVGEKLRFVRFRGNRFNIIFVLAGITFYHRNRIIEFLEDIHGTDNILQRAVLADIKIPMVTAGCKVLGLISKLVTAPLWRILESGCSVLDLNPHYEKMHQYFTRMSHDASPFLTGTEYPFSFSLINDDEVLRELLKPDDMIDNIALPMSQTLFTSLAELLKRMTADQLPGGKFWTPSEDLSSETSSVVPHNKLPEFVFGQLDFLLRYRPNATTLTNESFLMYSMNKTADWLDGLPVAKKEELLKSVRGEERKYKKVFMERCRQIQNERLERLKQKEKELTEKRRKLSEKKEKMTEGIIYYGLWQSVSQVDLVLQELLLEKEKCEALTAQLKFRKTVLCQEGEKSLFVQGKKGEDGKYRKYTSTQLRENLVKLIELSYKGPTEEKAHSGKPLLVGKSVRHRFEEGEWEGRVISVVPGYIDWYNIVYGGDDSVYTYRLLDDYKEGNLQIIPSPAAGYCCSSPGNVLTVYSSAFCRIQVHSNTLFIISFCMLIIDCFHFFKQEHVFFVFTAVCMYF